MNFILKKQVYDLKKHQALITAEYNAFFLQYDLKRKKILNEEVMRLAWSTVEESRHGFSN